MIAYIDDVDSPAGRIAFAVTDDGRLLRASFREGAYERTLEQEVADEGYRLDRSTARTASAREQLEERDGVLFAVMGRSTGVRSSGCACWFPIPAGGVVGPDAYSIRRDAHLRPARRDDRTARCRACCGAGERDEPHPAHHSLPSGHWRGWLAHRVRRRHAPQGAAAGARGSYPRPIQSGEDGTTSDPAACNLTHSPEPAPLRSSRQLTTRVACTDRTDHRAGKPSCVAYLGRALSCRCSC